jgi:hypothetical protein
LPSSDGKVAHGDGGKDWAVMALEHARAGSLERKRSAEESRLTHPRSVA